MRNFLFSLFLISISLALSAQKVAPADMSNIRMSFEEENRLIGAAFLRIPIEKDNDTLAIIYNYKNAFIVISTFQQFPPIKAFSVENNINENANNIFSFYDLLLDDYTNLYLNKDNITTYSIKNNQRWINIKKNGIQYSKAQYGPLLSSLYGQVNCKDENNKTINVTNIYTPNNYAVGCVAITFTELMQYYKWPRKGVGSHTYSDNQGSSTGSYTVDYANTYYNWTAILDLYYKKPTTLAQREQLGKLAFNAAVSINMDFEYNGSTSNINRIPMAANKYFRYTSEHIYKSSNSNFWERVRDNIKDNYPVQFAIYTSSGGGHAVVGDGFKVVSSTNYYHLNMGWWGSSNGWYEIEDGFNAGGYSNITAAVVDMLPVPEMNDPRLNAEKNTVDIEWFYPSIISPSDYELQVKIGSDDWINISDTIKTKHYSYKYSNTLKHLFRVRAKNNNTYRDNGWSEYMSIDIEKELNKQSDVEFSVYPTFISSYINVEYNDFSNTTITIYNLSGQIVYTEYSDEDSSYSKKRINCEFLKSGLYLLNITGENGNETKKFIKP